MKKSIFFILLYVLYTSCNEKVSSERKDIGNLHPVFDSLTIELNEISTKSIIPGFAVAIVDSNEIIYKKGFGYSNLKSHSKFTPQTVNFIASISKTFIGVSVMKLVEMGKLDLDEKVNDILPYKIVNPNYPEIPITVRQLVTHTAGVTDDFDPEEVGEADILLLEELKYENDTLQDFMDKEMAYYSLGKPISLSESIRKYLSKNGKWYSELNFRNYPPGTKYEYSNIGADLAATIVELKSGIPFDEFTKKYIFEPLEMKNTGWFYKDVESGLLSKIYRPDNWDNPKIAIEHPKYQYVGYTSGDLKSNIDDLCKYLIDMINGYEGEGKLLNASSYQTLFSPTLTESYFDEKREQSPLNDEYNVGIFWAVSSKGIRLHNGGSIGVYSFLYFNPDNKSGAVGFSNLPDNSFGEIRETVYKYETKIFGNKASR